MVTWATPTLTPMFIKPFKPPSWNKCCCSLNLKNITKTITNFFFNLHQIPAMAVEMPGSTDISGLNLQFGALQFGSEPVLPEYETSPSTTTPANQVQNSLYTSPSRFVYQNHPTTVLLRLAENCFAHRLGAI